MKTKLVLLLPSTQQNAYIQIKYFSFAHTLDFYERLFKKSHSHPKLYFFVFLITKIDIFHFQYENKPTSFFIITFVFHLALSDNLPFLKLADPQLLHTSHMARVVLFDF